MFETCGMRQRMRGLEETSLSLWVLSAYSPPAKGFYNTLMALPAQYVCSRANSTSLLGINSLSKPISYSFLQSFGHYHRGT